MGIPFFSRKPKNEAGEGRHLKNREQAPVLGADSLGKELRAGQIVLADSRGSGVRVTRIDNTRELEYIDKGIAIAQKKDSEVAFSKIGVEVDSPDTWLSLTQLRQVPSERLEASYQAAKNLWRAFDGNDPNVESIQKAFLDFDPPMWFGNYVVGFTETEEKIEISAISSDFDVFIPFTFFKNRLVSYGSVGRKDGYFSEVSVSSEQYLVSASVKLDEKLGSMKTAPLERNFSQNEVLSRLQKDFPWLEQGDLRDSHIGESRLTSPFGKMARAELNRLKKLYAHRHEDEYEGATIQPNDAEIMYLATRNYARLVEFAVMAQHVDDEDATQFDRPDMAGLTPADRERIASEFIAESEQRLARLNNARRAVEEEIFGEDFPQGSITSYMDLFISGDTAERDAYGQYELGLILLVTIGMNEGTHYKHLFELPAGKRREKLLGQVADIMSHENGHARLYGSGEWREDAFAKVNKRRDPALAEPMNNNFPREEIWNEWKSVLLPHIYLNEDADFPSAYQKNPQTREKGGAWTLQAMIDEMVKASKKKEIFIPTFNENGDKVGTEKLTLEVVLRSALATAHRRIEDGVIPIAGRNIEGFATLYQRVMLSLGKKSNRYGDLFLEKVSDFDDESYYALGSDTQKEKETCTPAQKAEEQAYKDLLLEKIRTEIKRQVTA